jgi:hypothetical protein
MAVLQIVQLVVCCFLQAMMLILQTQSQHACYGIVWHHKDDDDYDPAPVPCSTTLLCAET